MQPNLSGAVREQLFTRICGAILVKVGVKVRNRVKVPEVEQGAGVHGMSLKSFFSSFLLLYETQKLGVEGGKGNASQSRRRIH